MKDMRFLLITLMLALGGCAAYGEKELRLWYTRPAAGWLEALPIGNSHLGGMVYGGTETEEICLNEETFWSGRPYENNSRESLAALPEVRRLIFEGKEQEAARLIGQHIIKGPHGMRYLPLGSVRLSLGHRDVSRYERDLDLTNATASTSYIYNNVRYERTVFASLADDVIVCHMKAGRRGALSVGIDFASQLPSEVVSTAEADGDGQPCMLSATVAGVAQEGIEAGLKANCSVTVRTDGRVSRREGGLYVTDATSATLFIAAATNFVNYHDISADASAKSRHALDALQGKTYRQLLKRHVDKYREQFDRVQLVLSGQPRQTSSTSYTSLPTDERLAAFEAKADSLSTDLGMVSLMMQYGRYLLIASSQPGGQPATLQGIWNNKVDAPWDSKYTININTEMNYWPAGRQSCRDAAAPDHDARGPQHDGGRDSADDVRLPGLGGAPQYRPLAHRRTGGRHALGHVPDGRCMARHAPLAAIPLHGRQGVPGPLLPHHPRRGRLPGGLHADVPRMGRGEAGGRLADDRANRLARTRSGRQRHQRHRRLHHGQPDSLRHPLRRHPRSPYPRQERPLCPQSPVFDREASAHADRTARTAAGMAHRCRRPAR